MRCCRASLYALFCLYCGLLSSQDSLVVDKNPSYLAAGSLVISGLILNDQDIKRDVQQWVREQYEIPYTRADDILQHLPIGFMYLTSILTKQRKEEVYRQTRHLLVTQGLTMGSVWLLKRMTGVSRPYGGAYAFPSGHTAYAFAGATVMHHTLKEESPWLSYLGFVPALITGAYRIVKDKHWISDVVFGAGLGILMGQLSYHLDFWDSRTTKSDMTCHKSPRISMGVSDAGLGLMVIF